MSDTVKLIIEIPQEIYSDVLTDGVLYIDYVALIGESIKNGIPLDNIDSDETKAYFDGQAYGWEEGRKTLIDDVKAEIQEKVKSVEGGNAYHVANGLNMALGIIDNIGNEKSPRT